MPDITPDDIKKAVAADPALAREIYLTGRETHIENQSWFEKLRYAINRDNKVAFVVIIGCIIALVWFWGNVVRPTMALFSDWNKETASEYVDAPASIEFFPEQPPTRDCMTKLTIKPSKEPVEAWIDRYGDVKVKGNSRSKVKVTHKGGTFDFRFQPGIGVVAAPMVDNHEEILSPALFISPLEVYRRLDVDLNVCYWGWGAGGSVRMPFNWTRNTFLGLGVEVPYEDLTDRQFVFYLKVNF